MNAHEKALLYWARRQAWIACKNAAKVAWNDPVLHWFWIVCFALMAIITVVKFA